MRARLTIALTCMAACALVFAAQAHAVFPGKNGKVAYEFGHARIYAVDPDGGNLTSLFDDAYHYPGNPAWSPDGTKIAFNNYGEIWVMNADGTDAKNLTTDPYLFDDHPTWSPDATKIAFSTIRDQVLQIYVMNADGSDQRSVSSNAPQPGDEPAWSPDGTKIAFRGYTPTPSGRALLHVYTVNPDGTGLTNLTSDFSQAGAPDWSPDGKRIAFYGSPDPSTLELYSMNSDGTDRVPLTFTGGDIGEIDPAWSPDGKRIAYTVSGKYGAADDIDVINADGTGIPVRLTFGGAHNGEADWQPIVGPRRSGYKNAPQFCKAERDFLGEGAFAEKYGGGANAYGKCVSGK